MRSAIFHALYAAIFALSAYGETVTVLNPAGLTVVEVVTVNPFDLPTTQTLSTLTGPATSTSSATTTRPALPTTTTTPALPTTTSSTTTQNPGAVEDSPTAAAVGQTVYQYSTTDAAGNTVVQKATFTPTFAPTTTPTPTASGTILDYSQWIGSVGTATAATSGARRRNEAWFVGGWGPIVALLTGGLWMFA